MLIRQLLSFRGWRLDLHKFIRPDDHNCYHTHPAKALRIILVGGYWEEIHETSVGPDSAVLRLWKPLRVGVVRPELSHRVDAVLNGRYSYSLWLRWPKTADVRILGEC